MQQLIKIIAQIQKFVLQHRAQITLLFVIAEWSILALVVLAVLVYKSGNGLSLIFLDEAGKKFGTLGFILYVFTLLPSLIRRLKLTTIQPIGTTLMVFRRHLGILMFLSIYTHQFFTTTLIALVIAKFNFANFAPNLLIHHIVGYIALGILFPLWLTSNDFSVKKMGKWWKVLHRFTYLAMFFIMIHVALVGEPLYAITLGMIAVLEIIARFRK
ncbi:MAG: hypothetical protein COU65_02225 [Candidatus Pacebacteria bacterium CG10_big_fil_rev_8_21_14_0_10_42_12]|nr:hypothetical protein [Candidatus Paceibacterota bacterium]PIR62681.1 MAG: hypothetical protein COU65_02225 [Candidatus Pacebacteria bacterium CG10_big_fil_rev_8_21_14_0_10_42_12]